MIAFAAIGLAVLRPSSPRVSAAAGATATTSSTPAFQSLTVGRNLAPSLTAARDALKAGRYSEAITMLEAADATRRKSPYAQHVINELLEYAYVHVRHYDAAVKLVEAQLSDGFLTPSENEKATVMAAALNYVLKNYDEAIEFGNRAIESGSTDPKMHEIIGQAYYLKQDWSGVVSFEERFVNREVGAGRTPDVQSLRLLLDGCWKLADRNCEVSTLESLMTYYPSTTYQRMLENLELNR